MLQDHHCQQESTAEGPGCIHRAQNPASSAGVRGRGAQHRADAWKPEQVSPSYNKIWSEAAACTEEPGSRALGGPDCGFARRPDQPAQQMSEPCRKPTGLKALERLPWCQPCALGWSFPFHELQDQKTPLGEEATCPGVSTWMRTPRFWGAPRQGPLLAWGARRDVNIVFPLINPIAAPCKCAQV